MLGHLRLPPEKRREAQAVLDRIARRRLLRKLEELEGETAVRGAGDARDDCAEEVPPVRGRRVRIAQGRGGDARPDS